MQAGEVLHRLRQSRCHWAAGEAYGKPEPAAFPGLALYSDRSPHMLHQAFTDHEAKPSPAEPTSHRPVGLAEGLKQTGLGFWSDADAGIGDIEPYGRAGVLLVVD